MHPINKSLDAKSEKRPCDKLCNNYRFDHLETACVLSDVYSVRKGEQCAIHSELMEK